jgi:hypothetical protein
MKTYLLNVLVLIAFVSAGAQTVNITGVTLNIEGTVMYYTAETSGEHALYKSVKNASGTWDLGVSEDSFNSYIKGYTVKTPFLTCDEQTLYFSADLPGARGFDIFYSRRDGDSWSNPVLLSTMINSEKDEISPSLPAGNLTIYFARNGLENDCYNIYRSDKDIIGWSVPRMLPVPVSVGCERNAYVSPTGETLLFSSDRLSERRRKKYTIFYSTLLSENIWTAPTTFDVTMSKDYNEFTPTIDYRDNKIVVTKGGIDSSACYIYSFDAPVYKPYTVLKGTVKDETGKPVAVEITVRDACTNALYGVSNNNPADGRYIVVLPNDALYNLDYAMKNGARVFEHVGTMDNMRGQTVVWDVVLVDKVTVNMTVQDALSDKFIDVDIQAYDKTQATQVSRLDEGRYHIVAPAFGDMDVELYKENYVKENMLIKFDDYAAFPEIYYMVKLKPEMRSGVIDVKNIRSNQRIEANVEVKNLNDDDEKVAVSVRETGKYEFDIRKDSKYSISVTLKDYFYYYAVWQADASRIGQTLDVSLVPLSEINKIQMTNLVFPEDESKLMPDAAGELECIITMLKNNPEYRAHILLFHKDSESDLVIAQQRALSIAIFMETHRIPQTAYKVEIALANGERIPEISFVANTSVDKK